MSKAFDRRLGAAATAVGIRRKPAIDPDKARVLDDWFKSVTGRCFAGMSAAELGRLERLFGSGEPPGDDASELVRGCMDEHRRVVDLDEVRQRLDPYARRD